MYLKSYMDNVTPFIPVKYGEISEKKLGLSLSRSSLTIDHSISKIWRNICKKVFCFVFFTNENNNNNNKMILSH